MHVMRLIRNGTGAGLFAGLLIAGREVAMMEEQRQWLAKPLTYLPWPSLTVLIYGLLGATVGALIGVAFGVLLRRRTPDQRQGVVVWLAPVAVGAMILFLSGLYGESSMAGWPELIALVLLAMGVTLAVRERSGDVPFSRWLSIGVGALVGEMVFFVAADQIADADGWHWAARVGAYLGTLAVAAAIGWGVARLLGWGGARVSARWQERRFAYGLTGLLAAPIIILSVIGLLSLAMPYSDELALPESSTQTSADDSRPNVILISVDTLRADFVGYAGGPARTPNIDALAAESYVFENAYSVAPWTRPSFASFFSSRYPSEMGVARVRDVGGEVWDAPIPQRWAEEHTTLAEALRDSGYSTRAVVTNGVLSASNHVSQGFQTFHQCWLGEDTAPPGQGPHYGVAPGLGLLWASLVVGPERAGTERAASVTDVALRILPAGGSGSTLSWIHYLDPHQPYDPPDIPEDQRVMPAKADTMAGLQTRSLSERSRLVEAYSAEIEYNDQYLGQVLRELRTNGLWASSVIVFWSDHGEEFWEHGKWEHGQSLHPELCHVPLLIHLPGQAESYAVNTRVTLLDVMPTILETCKIEAPDGLQGRSLMPLLSDTPGQVEPLSAFMEGCVWGEVRKALLTDRYRLEYNLYSDDFTLYDLQEDPGEQHNIYGTPLAPDTSEMERELLDWTEKSLAMMDEYVAKQGAEDVPPEVLERLRDMGYVQ